MLFRYLHISYVRCVMRCERRTTAGVTLVWQMTLLAIQTSSLAAAGPRARFEALM